MRWSICALLFFATTINYVDRNVLGLLAKTLETQIGWTATDYGFINAAFQLAYAAGFLMAGRMIDRLGTRLGFSIAITVWSVAAMAHAAANSAFTFAIARVFLGLGEAANFPACIKTVAEWFPKKERALATGLFNAGANIGAVVAPLTVPWLAVTYGWQSAFILTGAIGFLWLLFWWRLYGRPESHRSVSASELALIQSDPADPVRVTPWVRLFPRRETWAFAIGKFFTDPVWWFYLFWLPKYLQEAFHLSLIEIPLPMIVVYNMSSIGSVFGGWLSSTMLNRGFALNTARKTALLVCALAVLPVLYAPFSQNLWLVVGLIGLATAAHQGWSANLFTLTSDLFPRSAVGSVVGIGGTVGAIGGALVQVAAGYIVQNTHSYLPLFLFCGSAYLVALLVIHLLTPRLAPARVE
jgi:ACS family hexuronate transporter-like MFS transporter